MTAKSLSFPANPPFAQPSRAFFGAEHSLAEVQGQWIMDLKPVGSRGLGDQQLRVTELFLSKACGSGTFLPQRLGASHLTGATPAEGGLRFVGRQDSPSVA